MGILRIMAVGRSGVGKSTIGNMLLFGDGEGEFPTSTGSESCTRCVNRLASKDGSCVYIDVPGLPDTNPANTAKFYDVIIKEAKNDLNVIMFVFKRDRIDRDAYKLAEMLFRELNKSNALKVLIINDHNSYTFKKPPTEDEYNDQVQTISKMTKIDFSDTLIITGVNMKEKLNHFKFVMSKTKSYKSEHMKNFSELAMYVEALLKKKNYEEEVVKSQMHRIASIERHVCYYQAVSILASLGTTATAISSFFTVGATLALVMPFATTAATAYVASEKKWAKLKKEKESLSTEELIRASQELADACVKFFELKEALDFD